MPDPKQTGYPLQPNIFDNEPSEVEGGYGPDAKSLPSSYGLYVDEDAAAKTAHLPIVAPNVKIPKV